MFSRTVAFFYFLLSLSVLAVAMPGGSPPTQTVTVTAPASTVTSAGQCNVNDIQCCNSVQSASSGLVSLLEGLLGIVLGPIEGLIGLGCSSISVIGVGSGSECNASPVCCTNNNVGGLISIGCIPITL